MAKILDKNQTNKNDFITQIEELKNIIEVKGYYSLRFFRWSVGIKFVITDDFNIFIGKNEYHYEICHQNGIDTNLAVYGDVYKDIHGEIICYLRSMPYCLKQYLLILHEDAIKKIIIDKILSYIDIQHEINKKK